jgi:glycyl-tRNA synthetase (class II)
MNRIILLENFCKKLGIFTVNGKQSPTAAQTQSNTLKTQKITYGPYGQLLLEQIKNEWIRANLNKFRNNFLISHSNILNQIESDNEEIDLNYYFDNLSLDFNGEHLPIGLINVFNRSIDDMPNEFEYTPKVKEEINFLTKYYSTSSTNLNCIHFCQNNSIGSQLKESFVDPLTFWQRERKNWWIKALRSPENVTLITDKEERIEQTNISYEIDFTLSNERNDEKPLLNWLENIRHLDSSQNEQLERFLKPFQRNKLLSTTKEVILTQTNCQNVLENVLFDSVEFPCMKSHKNLKNKHSNKTVFNLDYRLAPFKASILFESNGKTDGMTSIANDLKKQFYSCHINVLMMNHLNENELDDKYSLLDEMGIPYAIYLPSSITKDGLCFIRNRDTSLCEKTHISLVVKHFNLITNALQF